MQPMALLTHLFDACIKVARNAGFAEGHMSHAQEVQDLTAKLQAYERHITQLEGQLQGSEVVEAEKMEGAHQRTTDGTSGAPTTANKTVVPTAHTFCEFVLVHHFIHQFHILQLCCPPTQSFLHMQIHCSIMTSITYF
jgi:hypothetical protein